MRESGTVEVRSVQGLCPHLLWFVPRCLLGSPCAQLSGDAGNQARDRTGRASPSCLHVREGSQRPAATPQAFSPEHSGCRCTAPTVRKVSGVQVQTVAGKKGELRAASHPKPPVSNFTFERRQRHGRLRCSLKGRQPHPPH